MAVSKEQYLSIKKNLDEKGVQLVAVSKVQPVENILKLYEWGQRDFGENYVQELVDKEAKLPKDIRWHFIGHLQTNKVKYIAPFIHLVHGVDSLKLLREIGKQGQKNNRVINVLLQMHIATEETKFGLDTEELNQLLETQNQTPVENIEIKGLMGMASFTDNELQLRTEFQIINSAFDSLKSRQVKNGVADILSIGMSADYKIAIEEGSTMVRIGSLLFGSRMAK